MQSFLMINQSYFNILGGSKLDTVPTAYAIVDDFGNTLQFKSLPDYASVFTAEACASSAHLDRGF